MYGRKPKGRDEDGMTYYPIDRSRVADKVYGPTDPRESKGIGGAKFGKLPVFLLDDQMPRLTGEHIAQACDNVVRGQDTYASLLYLSRARIDDIPALFEASQSYEIKVRWERLWVLSPHFSRLARTDEGRERLLAGFGEDLAGVHLLSKFAEQNNHAVKRMFSRLHDPLLSLLVSRLIEYRTDPRRASLLAGIIGVVETHEDKLQAAVPADADADAVSEAMSMLYVRYPSGYGNKLSSGVLRDRLQQWRRG